EMQIVKAPANPSATAPASRPSGFQHAETSTFVSRTVFIKQSSLAQSFASDERRTGPPHEAGLRRRAAPAPAAAHVRGDSDRRARVSQVHRRAGAALLARACGGPGY